MPIAATRASARFCFTAPMDLSDACHQASGSCSAQPGCGVCIVNGDVASLVTMAPAVLTVAVLVVVARRNAPQPAALSIPFARDT